MRDGNSTLLLNHSQLVTCTNYDKKNVIFVSFIKKNSKFM